MLVRILVTLVMSTAALLGWEVLAHRYYRNKSLPLSIGVVLLVFGLLIHISSGLLGVLLITSLWLPGDDPEELLFRLEVGVAAIGGMWIMSIAFQAAQNVVRSCIGARTYPIQWINVPTKTRKRPPKPPEPGEPGA